MLKRFWVLGKDWSEGECPVKLQREGRTGAAFVSPIEAGCGAGDAVVGSGMGSVMVF